MKRDLIELAAAFFIVGMTLTIMAIIGVCLAHDWMYR
jgi:hypothetical protein